VGTFGERLQREREMRGITLEEIAEATKIGTRALRALEEQDFDKLPGGIFNKGFVRAYSKYLGIDEEQAVADYVEAVNEAQATGKLARPEIVPPAVTVEEPSAEPIEIPWMLLVCGVLLIGLVVSARYYYARHGLQKLTRQRVASEPSQAKQEPQVVPEPQPVATAPAPGQQEPAQTAAVHAAQAPGATSAPAGEFVVKVHANELSWVQIEADGKLVFSENMAANADRVVQATKQIVIKTGNAGGIELTQNGKPLPAIGPKHEVRTVRLTAQGPETVE
jgi:cytoskeleton protein RodZ